MRPPRTWPPRVRWGVVMTGVHRDACPMLLGEAWNLRIAPPQSAQAAPPRPLLFLTRKAARTACAMKNAEYRGRTDSLAHWRFRPVRVRESWDIVGR